MQLLDLVHADGAVADDVPVVRQGHAGEGAGALVWHSGKGRGAGMRILHPPQALPPSTTNKRSPDELSWSPELGNLHKAEAALLQGAWSWGNRAGLGSTAPQGAGEGVC